MKKVVISVGGSRIIPKDVDLKFIKNLQKLIKKHPKTKFIIVTGGGSTARKYMTALKKLGFKNEDQSSLGIAITRFHAGFLSAIFGHPANEKIPRNMKKVKSLLRKNHVVFCGALRHKPNQTTDATSAQLSDFLKCEFINITDVSGLYDKNPKKYKNAKLIKKISWKNFKEKAEQIEFQAGQHFVLDQKAAKLIEKNKTKTYITNSLNQADNILSSKKFKGTIIKG